MNFFIQLTKKYNPIGRNQTEEESRIIGGKILDKLEKLGIEVTQILSGDGTAAIKAYSKIMSNSTVSELLWKK
jgi:hypothetical protein